MPAMPFPLTSSACAKTLSGPASLLARPRIIDTAEGGPVGEGGRTGSVRGTSDIELKGPGSCTDT